MGAGAVAPLKEKLPWVDPGFLCAQKDGNNSDSFPKLACTEIKAIPHFLSNFSHWLQVI